MWSAVSSYEVLGDFGKLALICSRSIIDRNIGWLYSDFFLTQRMGGAAFFGLWLISNSKLVLTLAVVSHLSHWWFLSTVERLEAQISDRPKANGYRPHMQRLYGDRLRKDGGLTKTLKSVAGKTLADKAGKHAPDIQRVVREVKGSIEKVEEKVTEAVEEFLDHGEYILRLDTRVLTPCSSTHVFRYGQ
jgi:phosphatidylethanolamine N-methyltransferase